MMVKENLAQTPSPDEEALLRRLKRIEGQVRGLQRMVSERHNCHDIITQLLAARAALNQVGLTLLNDYLDQCLSQSDEVSTDIDTSQLRRTLELWTRFSR
jgi:DNA-binding FrmR family transcriptional regulator